jgi:hypothetical protein
MMALDHILPILPFPHLSNHHIWGSLMNARMLVLMRGETKLLGNVVVSVLMVTSSRSQEVDHQTWVPVIQFLLHIVLVLPCRRPLTALVVIMDLIEALLPLITKVALTIVAFLLLACTVGVPPMVL